MKKSLVCILLCFATILTLCLSSCSKKTTEEAEGDISESASESAKTLTMWMVSEKKVSSSTAAKITNAVNALTKTKFKINMVLYFYTEDEYYNALTKAMTNYISVNGEEEEEETQTGEIEEETEINEYGFSVIKYPEVLDNQVDIIYIGDVAGITGEAMYKQFISNEWLSALDTELSSSSKKIKEYVSPTLLSAAKEDGTTYAIPNNNTIGEYTYMLLNKELMQKYKMDSYIETGLITGFNNQYVYNFLDTLYEFNEQSTYTLIDAPYEYCLDMLAYYWDINPDTYENDGNFSAFGTYYTNIKNNSRGSTTLAYQSLFTNKNFTNAYKQLNKYRFENAYGDGNANKAAIKFVTGDIKTAEQYANDYYSVVVKYPTATSEDIYSNMFGVFKRTRSVSGSMEIITYLNTNAEIRNLIQYGIEGENYKLDENGQVVRLNEDYMMDVFKTGNAFIAYTDNTMDENLWNNGKEQNRSSLIDPALGFNVADFAVLNATSDDTVSIDATLGYNLDVKTGYSVEILKQNDSMKKWIDACDAKEKGVFMYRTNTIDGQISTSKIYLYNTTGNNSLTVNFTSNEDATTLGGTFSFDYVTGGKGEISVVTLVTRKSFSQKFAATVNETAVKLDEKFKDGVVDFDFLNTTNYSIEVFNSLTKGMVVYNKQLNAWLKGFTSEAKTKDCVMTYQEEDGDNIVYTFVYYKHKLKKVATIDVQPTGTSNALKVILTINATEDKVDTSLGDKDYLLTYVRVTAKKTCTVGFEVNTYDIPTGETTKVTYTADVQTVDPDFTLVANLNTELVKYIKTLNEKIQTMLNACTTYEQFCKAVDGLAILLQPQKVPEDIISDDKLTGYDDVKALLVDIAPSFSEKVIYNFYLRLITSTSANGVTPLGSSDPEDSPLTALGGEEYYTFDSPYAVYNAWLTKYGYAPKTK